MRICSKCNSETGSIITNGEWKSCPSCYWLEKARQRKRSKQALKGDGNE